MHCIIGLYYEPWRRKARRKGFKQLRLKTSALQDSIWMQKLSYTREGTHVRALVLKPVVLIRRKKLGLMLEM